MKNLLELTKNFIKVAGHKINIQKSIVCLYTNSELSEEDMKEKLSFTIA